MDGNKSGCKWHEILLFSRWKPQESRQQSYSTPFLHFLSLDFNFAGSPTLISSGCCIWLSKALHISYLISWDLHCEIWFERKLLMDIKVINSILQMSNKHKAFVSTVVPISELSQSTFIYLISKTGAQPFLFN